MARTGKKRGKAKSNDIVARFIRPTEQREAVNDFRSVGPAMVVVPVIVRLHEQGVLNDREFAALAYYRDQASLADRSPMRSCIDFSPKGGHGPGVAILSAQLETARLERDMGQLWTLCRAVCVDDVSLPRWCEQRHGSAVMADRDEARHLIGIATLELKYAAGGIVPNNS
jgi:hypothetical protein